MPQSVLEVQQLTGQARNPVSGQVQDQVVRPARVFNLIPDRLGGYSPYGRRSRLTDMPGNQSGNPVTLGDDLIGFDELGISSWKFEQPENAGQELLRLFRGRGIDDQLHPPYDPELLETETGPLVHLEGAGAYARRDAYLVHDRERRPVEPINLSIGMVADSGSTTQPGDAAFTANDVFQAGGTTIAVGGNGAIMRSTDNGLTWTAAATGTVVPEFVNVEHGNGIWMAACGVVGQEAYRSTDDGLNWSPVDVTAGPYAGDIVNSVVWAGGNVWVAFGRRIWRSADAGVTWGWVDDLIQSNYWIIQHGALIPTAQGGLGDMVAPSIGRFPSPEPSGDTHVFGTQMAGDVGSAWATVHDLSSPPGIVVGTGDYGVPLQSNWTAVGQGLVRVAHLNGHISGTAAGGIAALEGMGWGPFPEANRWQHMRFSSITTLADTRFPKVKFNSVRNRWVAVGRSTGAPRPRIWHSQDGNSWQRLTSLEDEMIDAGVSYLTSVTFTENGDEIYISNTGLTFLSGETHGLRAGSYNLFAVAYFNTAAGRFVFSFQRTTLTFDAEFGGSVKITAPGQDEILAGNPWLAALDLVSPGSSASILEDLRYDVYIQQVAEEIEGITPENTIRYAFTEPFPETGSGTPQRTIDRLPLGRQLIVGGQATTSVFEKSQTALHNGRVWGMLNQEEELWAVDADSISPELANQHSKFVLGYTEVNWANLMSDRSFIPLTPTQSQNFTGLISTPTGLLVLFDSEVLLITGDPAFGNVTVETYLDMGGGDKGAKPTKVGGMPFTVWNGRVWALQAGQLQEIAPDQYLPDDPFVRLAPEPQTLSLLALTKSGAALRYSLEDQFWLTDAVTRWIGPWEDDSGPAPLPDNRLVELLPNCVCESGDNTRFLAESGALWTTRVDGEPDTPHVVWRSMDFGAPESRKGLYLVKAAFEARAGNGSLWDRIFDRFDPGFDPDVVPRLIFEAANQSNGEAFDPGPGGQTHADPQPGGVLPVLASPVGREVGGLSWRLPLGIKSRSFDVRLELNGLGYLDILKLPVRFFHSQGGAVR